VLLKKSFEVACKESAVNVAKLAGIENPQTLTGPKITLTLHDRRDT